MGCFSGRLLALNLNRSEQKKLIVKHISFQRGQNEESEFVRRRWADCSLCQGCGQCSGCTLTQCTSNCFKNWSGSAWKLTSTSALSWRLSIWSDLSAADTTQSLVIYVWVCSLSAKKHCTTWAPLRQDWQCPAAVSLEAKKILVLCSKSTRSWKLRGQSLDSVLWTMITLPPLHQCRFDKKAVIFLQRNAHLLWECHHQA